ncbi:MAG TPA: PilT/PilU family type 4a pilus ATPase [Candidatus Saccharimonadales bacterium]|nr:PilT/PilU family type 4a pilus ATPase [Candidatus Saccharimonadales bacterium]
MRRTDLDYILSTMLGMERQTDTMIRRRGDVSDLNFTVDRPLQVEHNGQLVPVMSNPPLDLLTPYQTEMIALNLIAGSARLTEDLLQTGSCDSSYSVGDQLRFRVNIFTQRGKFSIVMRKLTTEIPTLAQLKLPDIFKTVALEKTGLVLVTGATGSGKSTTLAAVLNEINTTKSIHIITLEDPVEFVHPHKKATFNQREMGSDFSSFATGLRAALRQAPKVVLVGEMRDRETVEIGLSAAETGHLVLSTLHTIDSGQTINRILGMFEPEDQEQIRLRLADTLRWVISQRLAPRVGGGRHALLEIMGANLRTKETIIHGESEGKSFYEIIESNHTFGWRNFDQACLESYEQSAISEETALTYSSKRGVVSRGIDRVKKARGEATLSTDLKMKADPAKSAPAFPSNLKLK